MKDWGRKRREREGRKRMEEEERERERALKYGKSSCSIYRTSTSLYVLPEYGATLQVLLIHYYLPYLHARNSN